MNVADPSRNPAPDTLDRELAELDGEVRERLARHGFDAPRLLALARTLLPSPGSDAASDRARLRREGRNRVRGVVRPLPKDAILETKVEGDPDHARVRALGEDALRRGEVALCVLAGGMATRMGGVVKALVEVIDGRHFLDLRLAENRMLRATYGKPVPLWLMTSDATDEPIEEVLRSRPDVASVRTFVQDLSLRLTPDGALFRGPDGKPSVYAPGHGDLPDALRRSGHLARFRANGGRYVWIANLDNLGATIDPVVLGQFIERDAELMVEVVDKVQGDRGGIPVDVDGRTQVLEEYRLPTGFDAASVRVFNTNTFLVRADALESVKVDWQWFEVEKTVDGRPTIQFERLLQELTSTLRTVTIRVPRTGPESRFLPVKDREELDRRRAEILAVARTRGMLERHANSAQSQG
ncbi:MAG: UTP--glucose-1-phosphate uridylyltransferase [Polyangiaceae bacterium]